MSKEESICVRMRRGAMIPADFDRRGKSLVANECGVARSTMERIACRAQVAKGTLDGGHGVLVYHYGKQNALALWGSGPAFGMDAQDVGDLRDVV